MPFCMVTFRGLRKIMPKSESFTAQMKRSTDGCIRCVIPALCMSTVTLKGGKTHTPFASRIVQGGRKGRRLCLPTGDIGWSLSEEVLSSIVLFTVELVDAEGEQFAERPS